MINRRLIAFFLWYDIIGESMKFIQYVLALIITFILIIIVLISSFNLAIYGDSQYHFFENEYIKYEIADKLDLEIPIIMDITDHILNYLRGNEDNLSYILEDGRDFFNEQDLFHMQDVREIFITVFNFNWFLIISLIILLLIFIYIKGDWKNILPNLYFINLFLFFIISSVIFILCLVVFKEMFYFFHSILFDNNLWLFQPQSDLMIQLFPLEFFKDFGVRLVMIFIVFIFLLTLFFIKWKRIVKNK